jgi:periplasmic protein CpxP/Spy
MSRFVALVAGLLLAGCAAFAQDSASTASAAPTPGPKKNQRHGDSAEKRLKRMSKRLNLTNEQKEKLLPILQDEEKQAAAVESDSTLSEKQKHQKMHQIRLASRSQIDPILTAEQKAQMPNMRSGGGGGHRHQHPGTNSAPSADSTTTQ